MKNDVDIKTITFYGAHQSSKAVPANVGHKKIRFNIYIKLLFVPIY